MQTLQCNAAPERWSRVLGWATALGLLCGVVGPFGSYPANSFTRIAYWIMLFWTGAAILWPSVTVGLLAGARHGFPPALSGGATVLLGCIPIAIIAAAAGRLMWPVHASAMRMLEWYGQTLVIALPATFAMFWLESDRKPLTASGAPAPNTDGKTVTEDRIPAHLLETALCLQMEDHHVRIYGRTRSHLYLASMRQIAEGMSDRGMQVHRSWWVARDAVESWFASGRAVNLTLVNGLTVPVARNKVAILREHGWLTIPATPGH